MITIGIIGAGEIGSQVARAAIANGYHVVIANSRGPETLSPLIDELGSSARAATAVDAAGAGEVVVVAVPLKLANDMPVEALAGKPPGSPRRLALPTSSNFPEAVELVTRLYDQFGFDVVNNSPLREARRSAPGQPAWTAALSHQTRPELIANLAKARRIVTA